MTKHKKKISKHDAFTKLAKAGEKKARTRKSIKSQAKAFSEGVKAEKKKLLKEGYFV